jgi:tetratricopeptide (TPR) repeat protein
MGMAIPNRGDERPQENPNFLAVSHGNMVINVPYSVFKDRTYHLMPERWQELRHNLSVKYPWLSVHALDVIKEEIMEAMKAKILSEKNAAQRARDMIARDDLKGAASWLEGHFEIDPEDADAWYVYGEVLMKTGRKEEGFAALRKARQLSGVRPTEHKRPVRSVSEKRVDGPDHVKHRRPPRH